MTRISIQSLLLGLFLLISLTGFSQDERYKNAVKISEIQRLPAGGALKVGDVVELVYKLKIAKDFHVYCANQPSKKGGQPAYVELLPGTSGVELAGKLEDGPERQVHRDDVFRVDVAEFHETGTLIQKVKITSDKPVFKANLKYQVCDENLCQYITYPINVNFKLSGTSATPPPPTPADAGKKGEAIDANKVKETPKTAAEKAKLKADSIAKAKALTQPQATETPTTTATASEDVPLAETEILNKVAWSSPTFEPNTKPKKGDIITLTFKAKIDKGFHLYSAVPPKKQANLPTTFDLLAADTKGAEIEGDLEESGNRKTEFDKVFKTDIAYFEDSVIFKQKIKITEDNPVIKGYINYQVCDSTKCIPAKNDFSLDWNEETVAATPPKEDPCSDVNWWKLFFESFLWGFAAVITPCVFPMIPLTVSYFTKKSESRARGIFNASFYGLSIIAIYTFLGLIVSMIFGGDAMQKVAINPYVNLVFFAVLVAFALSFLGWFEITLPASWSTAMRLKSQGQGMSITGIFFMALTLAIVSFSCTGPLAAGAMGSAASGACYINPIISMLGFSSAIALPFSLFAFFPSLLTSMPKSGNWMNAVKATLGFLELALAFTYFNSADMVAGWDILPRNAFLAIWIAIFGLLGLYLAGKLRIHQTSEEHISVPRLMLALAAFSFVFYLVPGLWGQKLPMVEGIIPPIKKGMYNVGGGSGESASVSNGKGASAEICEYPNKKSAHLNEETPEGICAFYDIEQGMAYAKEKGKPVFLDFTGFTCKNCRKVEQDIWSDSEVKKMLNEDFVLISLYTDDTTPLEKPETSADGKTTLTTVGDKWREYQAKNYNFNAQPYYVLIDHKKEQLVKPFAYTSDKEQYKKNMRDAIAAFKGK